MKKKYDRPGRPIGTPGGGKYNCTTKVVRVPVAVADRGEYSEAVTRGKIG